MRGHFNHDEATERIAENVKNSAYEIIAKKKATYFGVAMAVRRICEAIIRDEKSILPVSNLMHGEFGISDISLSMPAIVGAHGVENRIPIALDEEETDKQIAKFISVLEPTLVIILSIFIGLILISFLLPLIGIMSSIG